MLTVGSLFSGIGGLELGLERTGYFKTIWQVEIDDYATKILEKHWPDVRRYRDIRTVHADPAIPCVPTVGKSPSGVGKQQKMEENNGNLQHADLICGGFPCQDISNAGKRKGITGERSGLWKEFLRIIGEVRPRYVLVENVAALANRGLDVVLCDLAQIGYDAEWNIVSAASVGAPHRRERIFIVAWNSESNAGNKKSCFQKGEITITGGVCPKLAHTDGCGHIHGQAEKFADKGWLDAQRDPGSRCADVADSMRYGHGGEDGQTAGGQERWMPSESSDDGKTARTVGSSLHEKGNEGCHVPDTKYEGLEGRNIEAVNGGEDMQVGKIFQSRSNSSQCRREAGKQWAAEPDVGRVAHGVPSRVDRLKCLGNAVVPQVAEAVGRMIMEFDRKLSLDRERLHEREV